MLHVQYSHCSHCEIKLYYLTCCITYIQSLRILNVDQTQKEFSEPGECVLQMSEQEGQTTFSKVKAGRAAGYDHIPSFVLKTCGAQLALFSLDIFVLVHWRGANTLTSL